MSARRLVVNVDHVATLRQARGIREPDPIAAALLALASRADGIVVHLREDRRHIQDRDVHLMRQVVHDLMCLEMAPVKEMLKVALEVRPDSVTLVPERREELTTEGGIDLVAGGEAVGEIVRMLAEAQIRSCVFIDPEIEQVKQSHRLGVDAIELHSGRYAESGPSADEELQRIRDAARLASKLGLEVGVGHGINYRNVPPLAEIGDLEEFSIGHSIVGRAVLLGMERAVAEMKALVG